MAIDVIQIAIDGENRVLAHLEAIQKSGQKVSAQLKQVFTTASTQAAQAMRPLEQAVNRVQSQVGAEASKLRERITKPIVGAYASAFKTVEGLAARTQTGQAILNSIERVKPRVQKAIVEPFEAAMQQAQGVVAQGMDRLRNKLGIPKKAAPAAPEPMGPGFDPVKLAGLAKRAGGTFDQASRAAEIGGQAGLSVDQLAKTIQRMKELQGLGVPLAKQQQILQSELKVTVKQFEAAARAASQFAKAEPPSGGGGSKGGGSKGGGKFGLPFGAMAAGLGGAMLAVEGVKIAFAAAMRVGQQFYGGMVAANEELNQQILGSAANLAATSRVFKQGIEIVDPTEKIQELQVPLRNALKQIAEDSIQLVGVTSGELTGVFATLNSQASQLTGQSKEFTSAIDSAGKLTIDFAAALGTIGLPLDQAGQEIRSILMGTIDTNSTLAKQLGITNEMVKRWKSQGVLVDELRKRLQPFVEGNALAAKSIGGVSSNIADVLQIIQRNLGEPLLEPIVEGLSWIYNKLDENRDNIENFLRPFINQAIEFGKVMAKELSPLIDGFGASAGDLQIWLLDLFKVATMAIVGATKLLVPLLRGVQGFLQTFGQLYEIAKRIVDMLPGFGSGRAGLDTLADGTRLLIDEQDKLEKKYEAIAEKKRQGIELTDEEKRSEESIKKQAALAVDAIDEQIKAYKSLIPATEEDQNRINQQIAALEDLRREYEVGGAVAGVEKQIEALEAQKAAGEGNTKAIDQQIAALEAQKAALGGFGSLMPEVELTGAEIQDLGNNFEQLARDAQGAKDQITELTQGGGDSAQLQQEATSLTDLTQKQVEIGAITREQAIEQLEQVRDNSKLQFDIRQKAADQIVALQEKIAQGDVAAVQRQIKDQEQAIQAGTVGQVEGARELTKLKKQELEIQLENIKVAIEQEKALRQTQIEAQIASIDAQIAAAQAAVAQAPNGAAAQAAQAQVAALEAQKRAAQASLNIQSDQGRELLKQQRETQEQLENVEIEGNRSVQEAIEAESRETLAAVQARQAELTAAVANGEKSRLDAAREGADLRQQELAAQLASLDAQIAEEQKLRQGADPTVREKDLMAQRRQLMAEQKQAVVEGERAIRDAQLQEMQETQDRLMDKISQAAAERELALQQAINANPGMDPLDRAEQELAIQRQTLEAEYQAEVENLNRLQALPLPRDPTEREAAENQIRDAILKTTNMAIELARQEEREQQAVIDRRITEIERVAQARQNSIEAERQALEMMLQSYEQIGQQMQMQLDLIDQQIQARNQYDQTTQSYYDIAAKFTEDEKERAKLEREAARAKISQLNQAHDLEELQLELKHQQTEAMLEQEIIQARINQANAKAAQAQAMADYAKAAADPNTRPEELEARRLGIVAADMQVGAADFQYGMAVRGRRNFEDQKWLEENQLRDRQGFELLSAEGDLASLTETKADDRRVARLARSRARDGERQRRSGSGLYDTNIRELAGEFRDLGARLSEFDSNLTSSAENEAPPATPYGVGPQGQPLSYEQALASTSNPLEQRVLIGRRQGLDLRGILEDFAGEFADELKPNIDQIVREREIERAQSRPPASNLPGPSAQPGQPAGVAGQMAGEGGKTVYLEVTNNNTFNGSPGDPATVQNWEQQTLATFKKVLDLV